MEIKVYLYKHSLAKPFRDGGVGSFLKLVRIEWQTLPYQEQAVSLNVSLPVELENRVREHVASGMYGSASEVIREALRLFEAYQATQTSQLQALRADIQLGLADVKAKRVGALDVDAIKRQGRQRLQQAAK